MVAWAQDGRGFIVKDVSRFSDEILTQYFRHSNFSSFTRQLNMYDFKKTRNGENQKVFSQPYFQRGKRHLLAKIQRKKTQPEKQIILANSDEQMSTVMRAQINRIDELEQRVMELETNQNKLWEQNLELQQQNALLSSARDRLYQLEQFVW